MTDDPIVRPRMPELDSLRGVAILSVFFCHGLFWSNGLNGLSGIPRFIVNLSHFGWLGVNLFFVLSGFLITGILLRMRTQDRYYGPFYARRARRILPALWLLLLALFFVPGQNKAYLLLSFLFCANLAPLLGIHYTYGMLWSLAVEEHFYLFWPTAVRKLPKHLLYGLIALLLVISPILRGLSYRKPLMDGFGSFTWLVLDSLAAGALMAVFVRETWCTRRRLLWISCVSLSLALIALAAGAPFGLLSQMNFLGAVFLLSIISAFFFALLGIFLFFGSGSRSSLVNWPALRFYGEISYGLYLFHWLVFVAYDWAVRFWWPRAGLPRSPAFLFLRCAVVLLAATILSYLSRWYFEEGFLRAGRSLPASAHAASRD